MAKNEDAVTLPQALRSAPNGVFYRKNSQTPNYNAVFVYCVKRLLKGSRQTAKMLLDAIETGKPINLSSFQRAVATESARRKQAAKGKRPDAPVSVPANPPMNGEAAAS